MTEGRNLAACLVNLCKIDLGRDDTRLLACIGQYLPPWRDDDRMPVGLSVASVGAALSSRNYKAAVLDCPGPLQNVPVRVASHFGKCGRSEQNLGARLSEGAIKIRKANIIADGQPEYPQGVLARTPSSPGL